MRRRNESKVKERSRERGDLEMKINRVTSNDSNSEDYINNYHTGKKNIIVSRCRSRQKE